MVPDPVRVSFDECDAGCLFFSVEAAGQSVNVIASHLSDPFAAMIDWLHAVIGGATFTHWGIDGEGWADSVILARRPDGSARLLIAGFQHGLFQPVPVVPSRTNEYDKLHVDALVDPMQVAEAFFTAFDAFIGGSGYCPTDWEAITLRRVLNRVLPNVDVDNFSALSPVDLALLTNSLTYPGTVWKSGALQETLEDFLARKRRDSSIPWAADGTIPTDLVDSPQDGCVEVPEDLDRWPMDERHAFIDRFLEGWVTSWHGDDLRALLAGEAAAAIRRHIAGALKGEP